MNYRFLEPGERIRRADQRNDGTKVGRDNWTYEPVPAGTIGKKVDESLTHRRPLK